MTNKQDFRKKAISFRKRLFIDVGNNCINESQLIKFTYFLKKKFNFKSLGIYYPIGSEISPLKFIDISKKLDLILSLPIIENKSKKLIFKIWDGNERLNVTKYRTFEPSNNNKLIVPDMALIPLLAFDKGFNRIGYGRGYYDQTINYLKKKNNSFLAVGLAYDKQEFDNIPIEKHDEKMDIIITEKKILFKKEINFK